MTAAAIALTFAGQRKRSHWQKLLKHYDYRPKKRMAAFSRHRVWHSSQHIAARNSLWVCSDRRERSQAFPKVGWNLHTSHGEKISFKNILDYSR
jgi:protease II